MTKLILFLPVLFLAVFLRFFNLYRRGVIFWDDGARLREVIFMDTLIKFVRNNISNLLLRKISFSEEAQKFEGHHLLSANTLSTFLYYFMRKIIKFRDYSESALVTNSLFGIAGIIGVFLIGTFFFNSDIGLVASLILAISGYHLMYSRSIHAEITSGAFYIFGTYFYYLSYIKDSFLILLISGIMIGLSFSCNSRQFYIPIFFVFYEVIGWLINPSLNIISRIVVLGMGMFLPLVLIEEFYIILKELGYPYQTYFKQLYYFKGNLTFPDFRFPSLRIYLRTFYCTEWIVVPILIIIGTYFMISKISFLNILLISQFFIPFLFWSMRPLEPKDKTKFVRFQNYNPSQPRFMSSSIYSMSIIAAYGLYSLDIGIYRLLVIVAVVVIGILNSLKFVKMKSGFTESIKFLMDNTSDKKGKHISFCYPISAFFVGNDNVVDVLSIKTFSKIKELHRDGYTYLLYVKSIYCNTIGFKASLVPEIARLLNTLKPVFKTKLGMGKIQPLYWDNHANSKAEPFDIIEIYDLKQYFEGNIQ